MSFCFTIGLESVDRFFPFVLSCALILWINRLVFWYWVGLLLEHFVVFFGNAGKSEMFHPHLQLVWSHVCLELKKTNSMQHKRPDIFSTHRATESSNRFIQHNLCIFKICENKFYETRRHLFQSLWKLRPLISNLIAAWLKQKKVGW